MITIVVAVLSLWAVTVGLFLIGWLRHEVAFRRHEEPLVPPRKRRSVADGTKQLLLFAFGVLLVIVFALAARWLAT
jgi:hypothetical protein